MFDPTKILARLPDGLKACAEARASLRELTTLRIGGPAMLLCTVHNPEQAVQFQNLARSEGIPLFILGGGSNVLADDRGFEGVVMKIATVGYRTEGTRVTAGAGLGFDELIARTLDSGLTGLEFASGIPGTLGGAVVGNAGCYGHEIGEFLVQARILDTDGQLRTIGPEAFGFRYRETDLRESGKVVLEVVLDLAAGDLDAAREVRRAHLADRRAKHPVDIPCAGSWFRNLEPEHPGERRRAAGRYLDEAGAKELSEGDARVFPKHANIVINAGNATSGEVLALTGRMKRLVKDRFGIDLIEEVRYLGPTEPTR